MTSDQIDKITNNFFTKNKIFGLNYNNSTSYSIQYYSLLAWKEKYARAVHKSYSFLLSIRGTGAINYAWAQQNIIFITSGIMLEART